MAIDRIIAYRMVDSEKIPQGCLDTGMLLAVPVDTKDKIPPRARLRSVKVPNAPRPIELRNHATLTRLQADNRHHAFVPVPLWQLQLVFDRSDPLQLG